MSSGPSNVKSTTTSEPPAFLKPFLTNLASAAQGQFGQVSSPQLINQGRDLTSSTLAGDYLSPDSNPYLQQTFDRAAQLTQNQLASQFAGAGRNGIAALPARSEQLQTLASNIFGGNYQAERNRQMDAINQGLQLDPLNLAINRLAGIIPGAGGSTQSQQPVFRTGLF